MAPPQTKYEIHGELRSMIQMYIDNWNSMGGEFKLHMSQCHSATQALEYLRAIPILSTVQRSIVSTCYEELYAFDQRFPALTQPDANEIQELRFKFTTLWDMFEDEAKRRGLDPETLGLTPVPGVYGAIIAENTDTSSENGGTSKIREDAPVMLVNATALDVQGVVKDLKTDEQATQAASNVEDVTLDTELRPFNTNVERPENVEGTAETTSTKENEDQKAKPKPKAVRRKSQKAKAIHNGTFEALAKEAKETVAEVVPEIVAGPNAAAEKIKAIDFGSKEKDT
ncbi:hypothetical protein BDZ45DRAFT_804766 [Acephala macrosclerotiorum]|nr:hypothetical protein BDZ45DRAFT_804766 [Acephala macrosclerotiorum]